MNSITDEIKNDVAEYFISDSREFLFRYQKLREFQTHISNRSKLMIDLIFSIECSLKAIIFLESTEDEKAVYKKIKTHDLKKLSALVVDKSGLAGLEQSIIDNSDLYNVSSRYTLDANINFRENNVLGKLYYDTIANFEWLDKLSEVAQDVLNFAKSKTSSEIKITNMGDLDLENLIEKAERINNISKP
ncbi:hypothetical protein [Flavobacterium sp. GSB-24]|uniref:hypothetical protein n=1 Tax=Flavobacterium sp. GSB-24 TaxID=2994319 RepID=UPI002492BEC4|nr:hypothetical protein [Flavobacterium sp. GSB-24]BDU25201.1 hypothetical protein FLGSB24_19450 [Flavobacterium sp. GSB-24]